MGHVVAVISHMASCTTTTSARDFGLELKVQLMLKAAKQLDLVSHTNSRSVRIGDLGFSPMDRGKLNGSGSVKTFDLTFLRVAHGCVEVGIRATSWPYCMRLRRAPRVLTGRDLQ